MVVFFFANCFRTLGIGAGDWGSGDDLVGCGGGSGGGAGECGAVDAIGGVAGGDRTGFGAAGDVEVTGNGGAIVKDSGDGGGGCGLT